MNRISYYIIMLCALALGSCRKDVGPIAQEQETIFVGDPAAVVKGMYVLNEGVINSNKASLDYVDFTSGVYTRNMYSQANPEVTKGLGDVGNDIGVYGSKLWVVVNNSNKVEVLDVRTCKRITQVDVPNCRYIYFDKGHAYVSAYLSKVGDPNASNGIVAEIDTATFAVTRQVNVGRQPEELTVVGNKLYVANSGGYSPPNYERTVSVVDLETFSEARRIDVAINLDRLKVDTEGNIYVASRGDYFDTPSRLYKIDSRSDSVIKSFDIPASDLWIDGDNLFTYSTGWNYNQGKNTIDYNLLSILSESANEESYIRDGSDRDIVIPHGIAVNPETKDIFICDAKDYVTPGTLYCYGPNGFLKWSVRTGDMPGRVAFVY